MIQVVKTLLREKFASGEPNASAASHGSVSPAVCSIADAICNRVFCISERLSCPD
jgi:hypothetical protein